MEIVHIHRKPNSGAFSIEKLFDQIRSSLYKLNKGMTISVVYEKHSSQGFTKRILNGLALNNLKGDIFHITGGSYYLALFLKSKKTIITFHDCEFLYRRNWISKFFLWLFWVYLPVKMSSRIIAISDFTKSEILKFVNINANKIIIIPDCILNNYNYSPKSFNLKDPHVLLIGTKKNKNLKRTLLALSKIRCRVTLIGKLSSEQIDFISVNSMTVENKHSLSEQDLLEEYMSCDLLVFASTYEGFGMPILEAQSIGRPVVTSNCSSMPSVAGNGAFLVDPYDIESIHNGIKNVIEKDELRNEIIMAGLSNVKRFRPEIIAYEYYKIYKEILKSR
jgi:glycosyltransferase involved in cell wall biosynthesis